MTKLEEVALAIHRARYPDAPVMDGIEGLGPTVAAQALVEARAAVEAMREPTEEMAANGANGITKGGGSYYALEAATAYRIMIDTILGKTKPGA